MFSLLRPFTSTFICAAAVATASGTASAQGILVLIAAPWIENAPHTVRGIDTPAPVRCTNIFGSVLGYASSQAASNGNLAFGSGAAWDTSLGCDVLSIAVATGLTNRSFTYVGERQGEIEVNAVVDAQGVANLVDADCAAAALGYGEFSSNVTPTITAVLTASAGETGSNQLGSVRAAYSGITVAVNLSVGTGEGTYPDMDTNQIGNVVCKNYYFVQHRARAYIKVWANEDLIGIIAECDADMTATVTSGTLLYTCPH
ncbi:MAG: hypothetical protein R3F56_12815 [Planctomycetota bacterium]